MTSVEESPYCVCQFSKNQMAVLFKTLLRKRHQSHNNICMSLFSVCLIQRVYQMDGVYSEEVNSDRVQ